RDPDRPCRLGHVALRSIPAAARRPRIVAGADRQGADVVRQPVGAGRQRPQALATWGNGTQPALLRLIPSWYLRRRAERSQRRFRGAVAGSRRQTSSPSWPTTSVMPTSPAMAARI